MKALVGDHVIGSLAQSRGTCSRCQSGRSITDISDSTKTKPVETVRELRPGGADHVFDFVGLKSVAGEGLALLGLGGGLYLVGVAKPES